MSETPGTIRHLRAIADNLIGINYPLMADELSAFADRLEAGMRGEVTTAPKTEVQWAVAYGGEDPNECAGVLEYDDQADAEERLQWVVGGFLATRTLTVWPWQRAEVTSGG